MRRFETMVLVIGMAAGLASQTVVSAQIVAPRPPKTPTPPVLIQVPEGSMTVDDDGTVTVVGPDGQVIVGADGNTVVNRNAKKSKAEKAREAEERRKAEEKASEERRKAEAERLRKEEAAIEPTFTATGGFENSREKALQSAILAAKEKFHEHLVSLDDPISRDPSTELVRKLLLNSRETIQEEAIKSTSSSGTEMMYRATVVARVKPEHIRTMRVRERSSDILGYIGILAVLLSVLAGFFRLDAMTKGYVTRWLLLGTVGVGALLVGLWGYAWAW